MKHVLVALTQGYHAKIDPAIAQIRVDRRLLSLGSFATQAEALAARQTAEETFFVH